MKIQAVSFKGAYYMCIEDSPRAKYLSEANVAWRMGYEGTCRELFNKAVAADGCAFAAREDAGLPMGLTRQHTADAFAASLVTFDGDDCNG